MTLYTGIAGVRRLGKPSGDQSYEQAADADQHVLKVYKR